MNTTLRMLTVAGLALVGPQTASAHWTTPSILYGGCATPAYNCTSEPAPRAAVDARGQAAVAWVDRRTRVRVAAAGATGRFGRSITLGKGLRPAVAVTPSGTQIVVWSDAGRLRFARRTPGHRFSRPAQLAVPGSKIGDDDAKLAVQPDGSALVVYENAYRDSRGTYSTRLRSVLISPAGKAGAVQALGLGTMSHDSFRASSSGHAAVCCLASPAAVTAPAPLGNTATFTTVASYAPGTGWSTIAPPIGPGDAVETVGPGAGAVALGTIDVRRRGDAGTLGVPGLLRLAADGTFAPALAAPVLSANRAFGPVVAIDGAGRDVLVYQEKTRSTPFSRSAPIYAVAATPGGAPAARQLLDRSDAYLPLVRGYRDGAIAAWETPRNRWRVSIERRGTFTPAPAPSGGPSRVGEDFNYSRDMSTGGRYVVLCWTAIDGSIRASVGVL
jgi:hypothetical protein